MRSIKIALKFQVNHSKHFRKTFHLDRSIRSFNIVFFHLNFHNEAVSCIFSSVFI